MYFKTLWFNYITHQNGINHSECRRKELRNVIADSWLCREKIFWFPQFLSCPWLELVCSRKVRSLFWFQSWLRQVQDSFKISNGLTSLHVFDHELLYNRRISHILMSVSLWKYYRTICSRIDWKADIYSSRPHVRSEFLFLNNPRNGRPQNFFRSDAFEVI